MLFHERVVKQIAHYIVYKPDLMNGLEVYVDADFTGGRTSINLSVFSHKQDRS